MRANDYLCLTRLYFFCLLRSCLGIFLGFALTNAQQRSIADINADLSSNHPMLRLLQGDVGSGKTIVAVFACLQAVENSFQAAIMAPTEIFVVASLLLMLPHDPRLDNLRPVTHQ
jgi:hypothetical protein